MDFKTRGFWEGWGVESVAQPGVGRKRHQRWGTRLVSCTGLPVFLLPSYSSCLTAQEGSVSPAGVVVRLEEKFCEDCFVASEGSPWGALL